MLEKLVSLFERLVIGVESLVTLASGGASPLQASPAETAEVKTRKPRTPKTEGAANSTPSGNAAGDGASPPAPSADAKQEPEKAAVSKDQVRALMQQLGELKSVAVALEISKKFATTNTNAKGQPYTGESIGTIDPLKYGEVAEALGKAIAEAAKPKAAESNPLDD